MSGKGQRMNASVLPISLRCWLAEDKLFYARAHDEVCNSRARRSLQIQPAVIMLKVTVDAATAPRRLQRSMASWFADERAEARCRLVLPQLF